MPDFRIEVFHRFEAADTVVLLGRASGSRCRRTVATRPPLIGKALPERPTHLLTFREVFRDPGIGHRLGTIPHHKADTT